jgi:uncharacterized protein (TIGR00369 family)
MITPEDINDMLDELWPAAAVRCIEISATHAVARLDPTDDDLRPGAVLSGPAQFAIADSAFWFVVSGALGRVEPMAVTSELSIRFLRPARAGALHARADLEKRGRTLVVATVHVYGDDPGRPFAAAQGTYVVPS